jgi:DNA end-binding protein Ku
MAARAIWKGVVTFADVRLPVKLYSAVEDRDIHFRLLHAADGQPVEQRMVHPGTGEVVPPEDIQRGVPTSSGAFAVLDADDLTEAEADPSRDIEITRFVPYGALADAWYDRPYYLGPDDDAVDDYFALAEALAEREREGIARWTMRHKHYVGSLRARDGYLTLPTLRHSGEVVLSDALEAPAGPKPSKQERSMAEQLVSMLDGDFDPDQFVNRHRERVLALIEKKAKGGAIEIAEARPRTETHDLSEALTRSLERAGGRRRRAS